MKKQSSIEIFVNYIEKNGPSPVSEVEKSFKKHNEIFLRAQGRGYDIRRYVLSAPRKLGKIATWYYIKGQENALRDRILAMLKSYKELGSKLKLE
jgi:hypothetical protein